VDDDLHLQGCALAVVECGISSSHVLERLYHWQGSDTLEAGEDSVELENCCRWFDYIKYRRPGYEFGREK
jgi:hypothetical protein